MNVCETIIMSGLSAIGPHIEMAIRKYGVAEHDLGISFAILGSIICLDELVIGDEIGTPFSFVMNKKPPLISKLRPYHFLASYERECGDAAYEIYPQGIRERFCLKRFRDYALLFSDRYGWNVKPINDEVKVVAVAAREVRRRLQSLGFRKFYRGYRGGDWLFKRFVALEDAALYGQMKVMRERKYPKDVIREIASDSEFDARVIAGLVTSYAYLNRNLAEITAALLLEP